MPVNDRAREDPAYFNGDEAVILALSEVRSMHDSDDLIMIVRKD